MKKLLIIILSFIVFGGFIWASTSKNDVISRMYQNGLTKFDNPTDFMETKPLRRDEASKFFVQYSKQLLSKTNDETKAECNKFSDLNKGRSDLSGTMKDSCKLGLFQGNKGKFMPTQTLTKGQAITVLIRMIDGKKDETQGHFAQKYYERALELGILNGVDINPKIFDYLINRGDVARLLYNAGNIGEKTTSNNNGLSTVCINGVCTSGTNITCKGSVCTSNTTTNNNNSNAGKPDLIIDSLSIKLYNPSNIWYIDTDYPEIIEYSIKNIGNGPTEYDGINIIKIKCYYEGTLIGESDVIGMRYGSIKKLGVGGKQSGTIRPTNGWYYKDIECIIDENNMIEEENENNNTKTARIPSA